MQSWLKSLLGSGDLTELPEELTKLLAQAKRDKRALRDLLKRSETTSKKIEDLSDSGWTCMTSTIRRDRSTKLRDSRRSRNAPPQRRVADVPRAPRSSWRWREPRNVDLTAR